MKLPGVHLRQNNRCGLSFLSPSESVTVLSDMLQLSFLTSMFEKTVLRLLIVAFTYHFRQYLDAHRFCAFRLFQTYTQGHLSSLFLVRVWHVWHQQRSTGMFPLS